MKKTGAADDKTPHCSFCGKSQHEVLKIIAGPRTYICDECVWLCVDIINERSLVSRAKWLGERDRVATP